MTMEHDKQKKFAMKKRNGADAEFVFTKVGGIWYWDLPHKTAEMGGTMPSLPLPDVSLDRCQTLKDCLDSIGTQRSPDWVGQVYADIMKVES